MVSRTLRLGRTSVTDRGFVLIVVLGIMTTMVMLTVSFLALVRGQAAMVTHVLPIEEAQRGFDLSATKDDGAIKVVLEFHGDTLTQTGAS